MTPSHHFKDLQSAEVLSRNHLEDLLAWRVYHQPGAYNASIRREIAALRAIRLALTNLKESRGLNPADTVAVAKAPGDTREV